MPGDGNPDDARADEAEATTTHSNDGTDDARPTGEDNDTSMQQSQELTPPPLPPRPLLTVADNRSPTVGSLRLGSRTSRPQLLSQATTALSLADAHTPDRSESKSRPSTPASRPISRKESPSRKASGADAGAEGGDGDDSNSLKSYSLNQDPRLDGESMLGDVAGNAPGSAWKALSAQIEQEDPFSLLRMETDYGTLQIEHEFDEIDPIDADGANEEQLLSLWKTKLKHFFILSASGKPIYSRHGDDQLISNYIGIAQTLISFYQESGDELKGFTAGDTRFVMLSKGPLNLVAVSRLGESDVQLRVQLESLYMQILSTLTLPSMEKMFSHRPSTDLRRPLAGTDVLLDGLADGFTRGSPSTLLSALECLRLRKTHRQAINDTLLKVRTPGLLYGLVVAAGRLVSVVRPKKHSLHPGDLHLIFNMLFEAGSVRAGGGENWIPLCLPGFNNTGYLYMYVSFFSTADTSAPGPDRPTGTGKDDELAIVLISANKESFFELQEMRNDLVASLTENGSLAIIKAAIRKGHASCNDIVPDTALRHFLYKSRGNVQFAMPSFAPHFHTLVARRRLMSLYGALHAALHARTAHLKVQHCVARDASALAWETPLFELYCVAGPQATRAQLAQGANQVVRWVRREEERVFIIGGAVF